MRQFEKDVRAALGANMNKSTFEDNANGRGRQRKKEDAGRFRNM